MWWRRDYCSCVGEHSQRQGYLGQSSVDTSRLSCALCVWQGEGVEDRRERGGPGVADGRPKAQEVNGNQNVCNIQGRASGERAAHSLGWRRVQGEGRVCTAISCNIGTEGCWEDLTARSAWTH